MDDKRKAEIEAEIKRDIQTAVSNLLVKAVKEGRVSEFDALVKAWADPNVAVEGRSLLCLVIAEATPMPFDDVVGVAQALIAAGADINAPGPDGMTPLLTALQVNHFAVVDMLLSAGADPNAHPLGKVSPLYLAVECDLAETRDAMTRLLLKHGADPDRVIASLEGQEASTVRGLLKYSGEQTSEVTATGLVSLIEFAEHARHLLALLPPERATATPANTARHDILRQKAQGSGAKFKLPKGPGR